MKNIIMISAVLLLRCTTNSNENTIDSSNISSIKNSITTSKKEADEFEFLYGEWVIYKIKAGGYDDNYILTSHDSTEYIGNKLVFSKDKILDNTFRKYPDVCNKPNYNILEKNTQDYFDNDSNAMNWIGYKGNKISLIKTTCTNISLNEIIMVDKNKIIYSKDVYTFYLKKL